MLASLYLYRGELLGLLTAIHHLMAFVLEFYVVQKVKGSIHCDNKGALYLDDHMVWDQLTVAQQLNVPCDQLAKQAVQDYISQSMTQQPEKQLLPPEQAAVFVTGGK